MSLLEILNNSSPNVLPHVSSTVGLRGMIRNTVTVTAAAKHHPMERQESLIWEVACQNAGTAGDKSLLVESSQLVVSYG